MLVENRPAAHSRISEMDNLNTRIGKGGAFMFARSADMAFAIHYKIAAPVIAHCLIIEAIKQQPVHTFWLPHLHHASQGRV